MNTLAAHPVVSREAWLDARKALLAEEKSLTRQADAIAAMRRELPWVKVEKPYIFESASGPRTLVELFGRKSQLIVLHFMYAPGDEEACPGCSHSADYVDSIRLHAEPRDVAFVAISRAAPAKLEAFKRRMGWKFDWVSSGGSDFNYDYGVSFTPEQVATGSVGYNYATSRYAFEDLPGVSVFVRDEAGDVFHTYSTYTRGLDVLLGAHHYLDLTPKGRNETDANGKSRLRYHDKYES